MRLFFFFLVENNCHVVGAFVSCRWRICVFSYKPAIQFCSCVLCACVRLCAVCVCVRVCACMLICSVCVCFVGVFSRVCTFGRVPAIVFMCSDETN